MIYNGISLDSVAPVMIEDIRVSPVSIKAVTRDRPIQAGADFVRIHKGTRTVSVTFALLEENAIIRQAQLVSINKWAKNDKEYRIEVPNHPGFFLMGVCTEKPSPSMRQWWENKLRLVFTCYDNPFWNSKGEKSAACGSTAFTVLGSAPPLMRIERTLASSASNQSYAADGRTMTFGTIPAGNMVIDLNRQTAVVGSTDIMQYFAPTGKFIIPHTGSMTITGTGTVKYRERWE